MEKCQISTIWCWKNDKKVMNVRCKNDNFNVEVKDNIVYYPIYMLMFIENENIQLPTVELFDLSKV